jgi:aklavinone 12-hydroxylase
MPLIDDAAIDLGYRYRSDAITPDGADDDDWEDPRTPTGRPGFRIPHVPVRRDGAEVSTVDLVGTAPVLLTGADGAAWARAGREAAGGLRVPLDIHTVGGDLDDGGRFAPAGGIGPDGAMLVRPDGFVAWRSPGSDGDAVGTLGAALARSLGRAAGVGGVRPGQ